MDTPKVKGTMLVDQVRMIRKFKDKNWNQYLTPEDWEIINTRIMDPAWYPLDTYKRCGEAIFKIIANSDVNLVRARGQMRGKELFSGPYKRVVVAGNPSDSIQKFVSMYGLLFNFSSLEVERISDKHVKVFHKFANDRSTLPYCHQLMGHIDTLVEMAGGQDADIKITEKEWEGAPATIFDIVWE